MQGQQPFDTVVPPHFVRHLIAIRHSGGHSGAEPPLPAEALPPSLWPPLALPPSLWPPLALPPLALPPLLVPALVAPPLVG